MNVKESTIESLYEIISQCFYMNRKLDRMVSVLGVDFACNNVSEKIHQGIAHFFPVFSDKIGELCLERYNINVEYGSTPEGKETYSSVFEIFERMEEMVVDFQNMFIGAMKIAFSNDDLQVYSDLTELMKEYNLIVEQVILLNDKIKAYGSIMSFDHNIDTFWIL